jgi:hypothetical protein
VLDATGISSSLQVPRHSKLPMPPVTLDQRQVFGVFANGQQSVCRWALPSFMPQYCCAPSDCVPVGHRLLPQSDHAQLVPVEDSKSPSSFAFGLYPFCSAKMPNLPPKRAFSAMCCVSSKSAECVNPKSVCVPQKRGKRAVTLALTLIESQSFSSTSRTN